MIKKEHYKFNPDTLSFEVESISFVAKVKRFVLTFATGSVIAVTWIFIYSLFFNTPREIRLLEENRSLLSSYDLMRKKMDGANQLLNEIEERDNKIYRAVFEEDAIPSSIRNAGIGGADRYVEFQSMHLPNMQALVKTYQYLDKLTKKAYVQSKSFDRISALAADKTNMQLSMPVSAPINLERIRLTSFFGGRTDPKYGDYRFHQGVDFAGAVGIPIYAAGDGVVQRAGYTSGYGNLVELNHGYGYTTRYGHLSAVNVTEGQRVQRGQLIGALGSSGKSTGPHLHYEVRLKDIARNPLNYFENTLDKESEELLLIDDMVSYGYEE